MLVKLTFSECWKEVTETILKEFLPEMLKRKSEALECSYEARKPAFCG
jgi:hypothetical protein